MKNTTASAASAALAAAASVVSTIENDDLFHYALWSSVANEGIPRVTSSSVVSMSLATMTPCLPSYQRLSGQRHAKPWRVVRYHIEKKWHLHQTDPSRRKKSVIEYFIAFRYRNIKQKPQRLQQLQRLVADDDFVHSGDLLILKRLPSAPHCHFEPHKPHDFYDSELVYGSEEAAMLAAMGVLPSIPIADQLRSEWASLPLQAKVHPSLYGKDNFPKPAKASGYCCKKCNMSPSDHFLCFCPGKVDRASVAAENVDDFVRLYVPKSLPCGVPRSFFVQSSESALHESAFVDQYSGAVYHVPSARVKPDAALSSTVDRHSHTSTSKCPPPNTNTIDCVRTFKARCDKVINLRSFAAELEYACKQIQRVERSSSCYLIRLFFSSNVSCPHTKGQHLFQVSLSEAASKSEQFITWLRKRLFRPNSLTELVQLFSQGSFLFTAEAAIVFCTNVFQITKDDHFSLDIAADFADSHEKEEDNILFYNLCKLLVDANKDDRSLCSEELHHQLPQLRHLRVTLFSYNDMPV